jgi:WD40 repeat protein
MGENISKKEREKKTMSKNIIRHQLNPKLRFRLGSHPSLLLLLFISYNTATQTVPEKCYKPELVIQTGHTNSVTSVAFSPDGKSLVSGRVDVEKGTCFGDYLTWLRHSGELSNFF